MPATSSGVDTRPSGMPAEKSRIACPGSFEAPIANVFNPRMRGNPVARVFENDAAGFAEIGPRSTSQLSYVKLSGGEPAGAWKPPRLDDAVMTLAEDHLAGLVRKLTAFANPAQPYLPRVMMQKDSDSSDYDHLSRYAEWMLSGNGP